MRLGLRAAVGLVAGVVGLGGLSSCGYDGWIRYSCQDPTNWETPECQKPQCVVTGTCPDYLLPSEVLPSDEQ